MHKQIIGANIKPDTETGARIRANTFHAKSKQPHESCAGGCVPETITMLAASVICINKTWFSTASIYAKQ
ncbi:MAG: hypothetical protein ACRYGK_14005 [Janthinobacterium lividum]